MYFFFLYPPVSPFKEVGTAQRAVQSACSRFIEAYDTWTTLSLSVALHTPAIAVKIPYGSPA